MDLAIRWTKRCWKCQVELLEQDRFKKFCPRCACDLSDEPIDIGDFDQVERDSWKVATDLAKIWTNWGRAYERLVEGKGNDYSLVHDFATEVMELAFPYLKRLMDSGLTTPDSMSFLRKTLNDITMTLLHTCQIQENAQKLIGKWSKFDEETKEEWLGKLGFTNKLLNAVGETPKQLSSAERKN